MNLNSLFSNIATNVRFSALLCCGKESQNFRFKNKINKHKPNIELCPIPQ